MFDLNDLEHWPVERVGFGLLANYRYEPVDAREFTEMSSGPPMARLVTQFTLVNHFFDLELTFEQEAYFRWWVANKIARGIAWFAIDLHTGAGMNLVPAMFAKNGIGGSKRDGNRYRISCKVLTLELPAEKLPESVVLELVEHGTTDLQEGSRLLRKVVHEEW